LGYPGITPIIMDMSSSNHRLPARDLVAGDEVLIDAGHGRMYYSVVSAEQRGVRELSVRLDLSSLAPVSPLTGERMDWSRYEIVVTPGKRYSVRRAAA
jgi:hypothetical protein